MKIALNLGNLNLTSHYAKKLKKQPKFPIRLCLCKTCGFSQIDTVVDQSKIINTDLYKYKSSPMMIRHYNKYAESISKKFNFNKNDFVLDIGCNDGILLSFFKKKKLNVLGLETSRKMMQLAKMKKIKTLPYYLNNKAVSKILKNYPKPKLITINNYLANIDNLSLFLKNLKKIIHKKGIICVESTYLGNLQKNNFFDWIYHDHLSYFSILPLQKFFEKRGFILHDLEKNESKGGSYRYFFSLKQGHYEELDKLEKINNSIIYEKKNKINFLLAFNKLKKNINREKKKILHFLKAKKYNVVAGYGASPTSSILIDYFELSNYLDYLVDDNPDKINTYSPGSNIPVFGINKIRNKKPNLVILLAWRFKDVVIKKLKKIKKNSKLSFVVACPLPKFKIYKI